MHTNLLILFNENLPNLITRPAFTPKNALVRLCTPYVEGELDPADLVAGGADLVDARIRAGDGRRARLHQVRVVVRARLAAAQGDWRERGQGGEIEETVKQSLRAAISTTHATFQVFCCQLISLQTQFQRIPTSKLLLTDAANPKSVRARSGARAS